MDKEIIDPKQHLKEEVLKRTLAAIDDEKSSTLQELEVAANIIHLVSH